MKPEKYDDIYYARRDLSECTNKIGINRRILTFIYESGYSIVLCQKSTNANFIF